MRDDLRGYVVGALGCASGVLVVDETGFLKKGRHSVGVGRQYSGTAGRIENCQVGVFLAYARAHGQALVDRRLYLPEAWAKDSGRRRKARVPEDVAFATKPAIARDPIASALDAGVPCAWVLADALYGSDSRLRCMLEARGQAYVLAVRSNPHPRFMTHEGLVETRPRTLANGLEDMDWHAHTAGEGSKGSRLYDWARIGPRWSCDPRWERWLLIRRSRRGPGKLAYDLTFCPAETSLAELAGPDGGQVAGSRWTVEECFQRARDDLGLDHCEARSWHGWHRHMTLAYDPGI